MENNAAAAKDNGKEKKGSGRFISFLRFVFVKNLGIKLISVALAAALVILEVAL